MPSCGGFIALGLRDGGRICRKGRERGLLCEGQRMLQGQMAAVREALERMGSQVRMRAREGSRAATLDRVKRSIWLERDREAIL